MAFFDFQRKLSRRLLTWATFSIATSVAMLLDSHKPIRDTGSQFLVWGLIDGAIAVLGQRSADKKEKRSLNSAEINKESRKLHRLLWINTLLDTLYIAGGFYLLEKDNAKHKGHGYGIILQGLFLFVFDWFHAVRVPLKKAEN